MGRILLNHHGEQEWIWQIMDAVRTAVTNGVSRFTQAGAVGMNELPIGEGGGYRFPARTRDELMQTTQDAADNGQVSARSPFSRLRDPARELSGVAFQVDDDGRVGAPVVQQSQRRIVVPDEKDWIL